MTTRPVRFVVSCVALAAASLGTACASVPAPAMTSEVAAAPVVIPFDNLGRDYVRVYLVSQRRQWLLGRVERGARAALRVPAEALAPEEGWLRLAVVSGGPATQRAVIEPNAALGASFPLPSLVAQKWTYSGYSGGGQVTALPMAELP